MANNLTVQPDEAMQNPNSITGTVYLGNILNVPVGSVVFEGKGILSAAITSNENNGVILEIELEAFEDVMICDAPGVQDSNITKDSGRIDIVLKENLNITKFVWCIRVIEPYQSVLPDITLAFNFVKRGMA